MNAWLVRAASASLLERTGPLEVRTAAGHVSAEGVTGDVEISTGSGKVRLGEIDGSLLIRSANGDSTIAAVSGPVRARAANGDISLVRAGGDVDAKTSNGSIRLGEVARGSVELGTAMGDLEIGIAAGTAARLEVDTRFGQVRNELDRASGPQAADETVEVHARTSFGDITIRRA